LIKVNYKQIFYFLFKLFRLLVILLLFLLILFPPSEPRSKESYPGNGRPLFVQLNALLLGHGCLCKFISPGFLTVCLLLVFRLKLEDLLLLLGLDP